MKGDMIKPKPGAGKEKPWDQDRLRWVLVPHVIHGVVPKVMFGFLQMLQITQGVHVCVVSAHVLGKCEPWPTLLAVRYEGKSSKVGETSPGIASLPHLGRLFDPAPGARTGLIPMDGPEASLHPFLHQLQVVKVLFNAAVLRFAERSSRLVDSRRPSLPSSLQDLNLRSVQDSLRSKRCLFAREGVPCTVAAPEMNRLAEEAGCCSFPPKIVVRFGSGHIPRTQRAPLLKPCLLQ